MRVAEAKSILPPRRLTHEMKVCESMDKERMKEVQEELLDKWLEHELAKMDHRKEEIEDENYLYAKCVGIPNLEKNRR